MSAGSHRYRNIADDTPLALADAKVLRRIVVNTGVASSTVTVTDTAENPIAIIASIVAGNGNYEFDVQVNGLVVTASDAALDVTVIFD
jgi:hypothetical protein